MEPGSTCTYRHYQLLAILSDRPRHLGLKDFKSYDP